ncbi:conjugal transfer protein TrbD [Microbulbifer discodermiae]|uniref:conjugal transfer protein TrbD n=1 Tax=Microbulbifer sp. 2201CG32-9 TaxID=3232309 RepID=UPI00345B8B9D
MANDSQPSSTPIYQALARPNLFMGGDREMVLGVILVFGSIMVIGATVQPVAAITAALVIIGSLWGLRQAAKADPRMRQKYFRSVKYKAVYRAHSRPFREG